MLLIFDEFINQYNNKGIDFDGVYGNQCMDPMHQYIVEVLGLPGNLFAAPTAYQAWQNANDVRFDKIVNNPNDPNQIPQKGDIVFWKVGESGHVAIFVKGRAGSNSFQSFDENWPIGSVCHIQDHTFTEGVVGWLHPKSLPSSDTLPVDKKIFEELVTKSSAYDKFVEAGYDSVDKINNTIAGVKSQIKPLQDQIDDLTGKLSVANTTGKILQIQLANEQTQCQSKLDIEIARYDDLSNTIQNDSNSISALESHVTLLEGQLKTMTDKYNKVSVLLAQSGKPITFWQKLLFLFT